MMTARDLFAPPTVGKKGDEYSERWIIASS